MRALKAAADLVLPTAPNPPYPSLYFESPPIFSKPNNKVEEADPRKRGFYLFFGYAIVILKAAFFWFV